MHPEASRLFALDEALRVEADEMLRASGIGDILAGARFCPVGSYQMRTMVWRDLDFERYEEPDWGDHWAVGTEFARTGWCWRLNCVNVYRERSDEQGLYWGIRLSDPSRPDPAHDPSAPVWKLDLWTGGHDAFAAGLEKREVWAPLLTEEARSHVLAIKEAMCAQPEYRRTMLSVHVYEAVFEEGVRGVEEFRRWWEGRYGGG